MRALLRVGRRGPHTLDTSTQKAYTSATLQPPTTRLLELVNSTAAGVRGVERLLLLGGGLPIVAGGEVVGAIGVGGAPGGDKDDACAQAGIADRLK